MSFTTSRLNIADLTILADVDIIAITLRVDPLLNPRLSIEDVYVHSSTCALSADCFGCTYMYRWWYLGSALVVPFGDQRGRREIGEQEESAENNEHHHRELHPVPMLAWIRLLCLLATMHYMWLTFGKGELKKILTLWARMTVRSIVDRCPVQKLNRDHFLMVRDRKRENIRSRQPSDREFATHKGESARFLGDTYSCLKAEKLTPSI